ncbi:MAG: phenylacetate--CoA ligase family protein [Rubrivivax sp.]|nr:phenylacetate--CoA ligase family protein [Rubrivivax sp.]
MPHLPAMDPWLWSRTLAETYAAGLDPQGVGRAQRDARLRRLLAAAAEGSPLYRERLLGRAGGAAPTTLDGVEPVSKAELMQRFDDWATDRAITLAGAADFVADPTRLADAYLGRYLVWTSSGTTGQPGIFVQDEASLAAFDALDLLRFQGHGPAALPGMAFMPGQRYAYVAAIEGHFAGVASIERLDRIGASMAPAFWPALAWMRPAVQTFSVLQPLPQLLAQLEAFAPTILISYPSSADLIAQAVAEGRAALRLREVWVGGEQLSAEQRAHITRVFDCRIRNNYGASEFYSIAWECPQGRMHLNDDWVIVEPVDRDDRPVPPGEASHAVLLTNLANRTQPLLRYRLSDSLRFLPQGCACGSGFPAVEVQGRADDTLTLHNHEGHACRLLPLALMTVIEEGAQLTQFQLLANGVHELELRLEAGVGDPAAAFARAQGALTEYLAQEGLHNVRVVHGCEPPRCHPRSGKLSRVVAAG